MTYVVFVKIGQRSQNLSKHNSQLIFIKSFRFEGRMWKVLKDSMADSKFFIEE